MSEKSEIEYFFLCPDGKVLKTNEVSFESSENFVQKGGIALSYDKQAKIIHLRTSGEMTIPQQLSFQASDFIDAKTLVVSIYSGDGNVVDTFKEYDGHVKDYLTNSAYRSQYSCFAFDERASEPNYYSRFSSSES